jgi:hypothetical protein
MTTRLALALALLSITIAPAGCGDDDGGSGEQPDAAVGVPDAGGEADAADQVDAAVQTFATHVFQRSCAPTDGPAITVSLSSEVDPETCTPNYFDPTVVFAVYTDSFVIDAPASFSFGVAPGGDGRVCPGAKENCDEATAGDIHFDTFEDGETATGTWMLVTDDGPVSGTFDATWCEPEGGGPFCG